MASTEGEGLMAETEDEPLTLLQAYSNGEAAEHVHVCAFLRGWRMAEAIREAIDDRAPTGYILRLIAAKLGEDFNDRRMAARTYEKALLEIAATDWGWAGGGSGLRYADRAGQIARKALGLPRDPEPYSKPEDNWRPRF